MAADLQLTAVVDRLRAAFARGSLVLRTNLSHSRSLVARRRHDIRFRVLPYDALQILNAAVVAATLIFVGGFALDPFLVAWQAHIPAGAVAFFHSVTRFGKSDWILISTGLFAIVMLSLDASKLRARWRVRRAVRSLAAFYVFASVALSGIIADLLKYSIGRARPKLFPASGDFAFHLFSGDSSWASFPSGHATTAFALGLSLALLFTRLRWVFLSLALWIAMSRLFISAHYPSDVLAGGLLGALVAWLIARAMARYRLVFGFDKEGRLTRREGASGRLF